MKKKTMITINVILILILTLDDRRMILEHRTQAAETMLRILMMNAINANIMSMNMRASMMAMKLMATKMTVKMKMKAFVKLSGG